MFSCSCKRGHSVRSRAEWPLISPHLWYVGEPFEQGTDAVKVLAADVVRDAVLVHDLHTAQLIIGGVYLTAQQLQACEGNGHPVSQWSAADGTDTRYRLTGAPERESQTSCSLAVQAGNCEG